MVVFRREWIDDSQVAKKTERVIVLLAASTEDFDCRRFSHSQRSVKDEKMVSFWCVKGVGRSHGGVMAECGEFGTESRMSDPLRPFVV